MVCYEPNRHNHKRLDNQKGIQLLQDIKYKDLAVMVALLEDVNMKLVLQCQPSRKVRAALGDEKELEGQPVCSLFPVDKSLNLQSKGKCSKVVTILVLPICDVEVPSPSASVQGFSNAMVGIPA